MTTTVDLGKVRPVWKGTWSGSTAYEVHDMVKEGVDSYICTTGHTSGSTFSATNWDYLSQGAQIPDQSGNAGEFLTTDGTNLSWGAVPSAYGLQSQQVFSTAGSYTWNKPAGINTIKVYVTGAGGGGGGGYNNNNVGGGGGAGGTAIKIIDVSAVSTVSVTVGAGGGGGALSNSGSGGGTSSFGAYCSASGGTAGYAAQSTNWASGNPGTGTSGDINIDGGQGGAPGAHASNDEVGGGHGGASYWGGGGRPGSGWQNLGPTGGRAFGSGGGGGMQGSGSDTGAGGRQGVVVIEEYA